jgi:hypothetical protein
MTAIPIRGCHRCNPKEWKQVGPSSATYLCKVCRKPINQILERRKRNDLHSQPVHSQEQESDAATL